MMYRNALVHLSLHFCPKTGLRIGMGILSRRLTEIVDDFLALQMVQDSAHMMHLAEIH